MLRKLFIFLLILSVASQANGQGRLSAGIRSGYPFSPQEELLNGENSLGRPLRINASADIQYAFMFPESSRIGRLFPTTYQGIGLSVFSIFDHKDIGTPVSLYIFQGARIAQLTPHLSLDYEWNFGASFGWHCYADQPFNTIMGSRTNAYINGSIMLTWSIGNGWKIAAGPEMSHFSNGHTSLPNAGLNTIGMRLNVIRTDNTERLSGQAENIPPANKWSENISCDITAYGALKKYAMTYNESTYIVDGHFGVCGININPFYDLNRHFRVGLSLDMNYDESANIYRHVAGLTDNDRIRFYRPPFDEQYSIGLSARVEFVMPIFSINFGTGHNIVYKGADLDGLYQIIALKTHITRRLYIHTGYQFRKFKYPDHLVIGLGWRLGHTEKYK